MANNFLSLIKTIFFISILFNIKFVYSQSKCNITIPFSSNDINGIIIKNPVYESNIESCWYMLKVEEGYGLSLEFQMFNLQEKACFDEKNNEACCDYLQIGTGSAIKKNVFNTYCGSKQIEPIIFQTNSIWFNFHTDDKINLEGFKIKVKPVQLDFSEPSGRISSPELPFRYINNLNLTYTITTEDNSSIFLRFEKFSIESYNSTCIDYLEIGNTKTKNITDSTQLKVLCGEEIPEQFVINSNKVYLRFFTDRSEIAVGFSLFYNTIKNLYTKPTGVIEASDYPLNLTYRILAPKDKKIELTVENFGFSKCLINNINQLVESPQTACSLFNDHLIFMNEIGSLNKNFYKEIKNLYSSVKGNDVTKNWIYCACNKPARVYVSLTNELLIKHFLSKKENFELNSYFRISYKFIPADYENVNRLRVVQNHAKTSFIGGYMLNIRVPVGNHLRLFGKSTKCSFPKQTLVARVLKEDNTEVKQLSLISDEFKKNCSYLFDLNEPKSENTRLVLNKNDWKISWFLKFDNSFDLYDFELNWDFVKNEFVDEKLNFIISLPKQTSFYYDKQSYDDVDLNELDFHFKTSNMNRKYSIYFNIDQKDSTNVHDLSNYIKLGNKNQNNNENLISADHLTDIKNALQLNDDSILKLKLNNKYSIDILVKISSQIGDCNFDQSVCDFTTNLFVNSTYFPNLFSNNHNEGYILRHLPKHSILNTNHFQVSEKTKDFYLSILTNSEIDESIYSPLILVQNQVDTENGKKISFNKNVYSISFSYAMSNKTINKLDLFFIHNRSDIETNLKADFYKEIISHYKSDSHLNDIKVSLIQANDECQSPTFTSLLKKTEKNDQTRTDSNLNWYRVNKIKFFSCYDFRFGFEFKSTQNQKDTEKQAEFQQYGLDDIELNVEGEIEICEKNICSDNGKCFELDGRQTCCCDPGYEGENCEKKLSACEQTKILLEDTEQVCKNGGKCKDLSDVYDYKCECAKGFTGKNCEKEINECESNPCQNNGKCIDGIASYECICKTGFSGKNCQKKDLDCKEKCSDFGTSECYNDRSNIICKCKPDFTGDDCSFKVKVNKCLSNPCIGDSKCVNQGSEFKCICPEDRTGNFCEVQLNYCKDHENLCTNGSACLYANQNGTKFNCSCAAGFTGPRCNVPINECDSNPCLNGKCIDFHLGYKCECNKGFIGKNCDIIPKDPCYKNKCKHGTCIPNESNYTCSCYNNFDGEFCEKPKCDKETYLGEICNKEGTLDVLSVDDKCLCICNKDFTGSNCDMRINLCDLRAKNVEFEPECQNGGSCVFNNQTNQIKCMCKDGFFGDRCQLTENHCKSSPCLYGNCRNDKNSYKCVCVKGWEGTNCDKQINPCNIEEDCVANNTEQVLYSKNNCVCSCKLGFTGERCQINMNNCLPDPCQNNGKCVDLVGSFECVCPLGFTGPFCEKKIENCDSNPCKYGKCEMAGRLLTCICDKGYNGDFCDKPIDKCEQNPCKNGAKCHNLIDDYYCECPPEFGETKNCSVRLKNPCDSSPCFHNGTCFPVPSEIIKINDKSFNTFSGFTCKCPNNYKGEFCEQPADPCSSNPCNNRGLCVLSKDGHSFICKCYPAFTGKNCETYFDPCKSGNICKNGGTCLPTPEGFKCKCPHPYSGENCEDMKKPCDLMKCMNGGECVITNNVPSCRCPNTRFIGTRCEIDISLVNSKNSPLKSALSNSINCDVLGNDVGTIDYIFLGLIVFGILIIIISIVYVYVYFGIKRAKNYHKQVQHESEVLGEMNEIEKRYI